MDIISFLLGLLLIIIYQLSLAYIGVSIKLKNTIIPCLLFAVVAYISKIIFNAPPILHTIVIMFACAIILHTINKIDLLLSVIGSLLSVTTLVLGSLLIGCPLIIKIGFEIPNETTGIQWVLLNLIEFFIPTLVLIILKITKVSPVSI